MSGTSRLPSPGTPGATCQSGLAKRVLTPPPVASRPITPLLLPLPPLLLPELRGLPVSFQAISGM